jgi:tetratricopeptide (TPR) repeat protein
MSLPVAIAEPAVSPLTARAADALARALTHHRAGRVAPALAGYDEVLGLFPRHAEALINRATALRQLGRREDALAACWQAIDAGVDAPTLRLNAVHILLDLNRLAEARTVAAGLVRRHPHSADGWYLSALLLSRQHHEAAAQACLRRAAALAPRDTTALTRLAAMQSADGHFDIAEGLFTQAQTQAPLSPAAHSGYAQTLISQGRLDEAERHLRRALELDADQLDAHLGLARLLLLKGELAAGWIEYEWRRRKPEAKRPKLAGPEWDGAPLPGKILLVYAEQGFGDVLQFVRYMPRLAALGGRIVLAVPPELLRLLDGIEGVDAVVSNLHQIAKYDTHIPLLSVPRLVGVSQDDIPAPTAYRRLVPLAAPLPAPLGTRLKVGIVWAGSPKHSNDRNRSLALETLLPLAAVAGVRLYSLQLGPHVGDLAKQAHPALIHDLSPLLGDFADTAAVIGQLDLVICVDTAIAHLAATLGKPVWMLTPCAPDWRWMQTREDSPWYASLRLLRQRQPGRWDDVVARAVADLTALADKHPADATPPAAEAVALMQEGARLQTAERIDQALALYARAAALDQRMPDLFNNLGVALRGVGRLAAAVTCYRRALALRPDAPGILSNLGNVLRERGLLEDAEAVHGRALALSSNEARLHYNLGLVLRDDGRPAEARAAFDAALRLEPDNSECRWDWALSLLQDGDYRHGFPAYESRWGLKRSPPRKVPLPRWQGEPLAGRTIFLHDEQGFGDVLQWARFIPQVRARGAGRVVVECQPELLRLMALAPGVDAVVPRGSAAPPCDVYAPLLSLPGLFGITLDSLTCQVPYLRAPEPSLPLPADPRLRVGLVWAGKPTPRDRSCPLDRLLPLLSDPRLDVLSLQVGPRGAELKALGGDSIVTDLGPRLFDFAETAAVMSKLDLLVTIDTSVVHLAGALGLPSFVLLLYTSDWRWFDSGDSSPWYPSLRLFRQDRPNQWDGALAKLEEALDAFATARRGALPSLARLQSKLIGAGHCDEGSVRKHNAL